jgi:hypothetical protein
MHVRCASAWPRERAVWRGLRSVYIHEIEAVVHALLLESEWVLIEDRRIRLPRANLSIFYITVL